MKKFVNWTLGITFLLLLIVLGVIGVKIFTNNYDFTSWAYALLVCWVVMLACLLYKRFTDRCPHCGKLRYGWGGFCSHCGEQIGK